MTSGSEEPQDCALPGGMRDIDRDSLHILPLSIIPFRTPALTRARMIKNVRLESVVELFDDPTTGSGQVDIEDLPRAFGWSETAIHPDLRVIRKLALLPSFDMYSLRVLLREHGIPVNDLRALRLSRRKNAELTAYMTRFTRPLIMHIYGAAGERSIDSFEDLVALFRDPDVGKALSRLKLMAARLEIRVDQVPKFLEDYGDIFLSLSYYRQALDGIEPIVADYRAVIEQLRDHWQLRKDANLMTTCAMMQDVLESAMTTLKIRFDRFDRSTADLWRNISADRFRKVQNLIASYHTTIGGVLCALTVKMDAWSRKFPSKDAGGPIKRADFIFTEMRPGFDRILQIEQAAPRLSDFVP